MVRRINVDNRIEGTRIRVDDGSEDYEASGEFGNEGPILDEEIYVRGNHVWCTEPMQNLV